MALILSNTAHYSGFFSTDYNSYNYQEEEDDLATVIGQNMTSGPHYYGGFYNTELPNTTDNYFDQVSEDGLDQDIQEMIVDYSYNITPTCKPEPSDNESYSLDFDNLDFLDGDIDLTNSESDESRNGLEIILPSTFTRRASDSSGYSTDTSRIPHIDDLYNTPIKSQYEDDDDDLDNKPYCKSNRGAKHNLLWKFILQSLNEKRNVSWVDKRNGTFKFDDTATFSKLWGERKRKNDMNFEKLSRGIRHYYKSGLMSRISSERLVYKFNWPSVPKRYRLF